MLGRQKQLKYEHEFVNLMNEQGHLCQRIAGSGCGKYSFGDCILVKERIVFLTELKATKEEVFRINGKKKTQITELREQALKHPPLVPLLVVRWKNKQNNKWSYTDLTEGIPKKVVYNERNE